MIEEKHFKRSHQIMMLLKENITNPKYRFNGHFQNYHIALFQDTGYYVISNFLGTAEISMGGDQMISDIALKFSLSEAKNIDTILSKFENAILDFMLTQDFSKTEEKEIVE